MHPPPAHLLTLRVRQRVESASLNLRGPGGACGSILVNTFNKHMKALGVFQRKWDPVRKKVGRRLLQDVETEQNTSFLLHAKGRVEGEKGKACEGLKTKNTQGRNWVSDTGKLWKRHRIVMSNESCKLSCHFIRYDADDYLFFLTETNVGIIPYIKDDDDHCLLVPTQTKEDKSLVS